MNVFQSCSDSTDAVDLYRPQGLFLKPSAKVHVSVQLPPNKQPGKNISNWEVMEKLKQMVKPAEFGLLKVAKSTIEFIRFEGEVENKSQLSSVLKQLDMRTLKLAGFSDSLKVRAVEAKIEFPTRHTWDSYFRNAKNMNEMKPGERPDTLHLSNLPCKWFCSKSGHGSVAGGDDKPDEYVFRKVFEKFGEIRCVDVPACDPYRIMMKAHISGIKMFSFGQDHLFEGYVQYKDYMSFVKAMDSLRGMKLLHKEGDRMFTAGIKVDFDKTKHLSDGSIKRRQMERDKLMALERERDERERQQQEEKEKAELAARRAAEEELRRKSERRSEREERRKCKQLRKLREKEAAMMNEKIATEERKLLLAQRQLEAIRLLDFLFERVKEKKQRELVKQREHDAEKQVSKELRKKDKKEKKRLLKALLKKERLEGKERDLRTKLLKKFSSTQERELEKQRERLRKTIEGKKQLKSVLAAACVKAPQPAQDPAQVAQGNVSMPFVPVPGMQDPHFAGHFTGYPGPWFPGNGAFGFDAYSQPFFGWNGPIRGRGFFPRGRGGFRGQRRPNGYHRGSWHGNADREYYKYFRHLARGGARRSNSRSLSRERSHSKSRRRRRSRSDSRHRSSSRSHSRSNRRHKSHSRSNSRHRSSSRSNSRSNRRHKSHSRSNSRHRSSSRSNSRSNSRRKSCSRSKSKHKSRSRSKSLQKSSSRSKRKLKSGSRSNSRHNSRSRSSSRHRNLPRSSSGHKSGSKSGSGHSSQPTRQGSPKRERESRSLSKVSSFTFSEEESPGRDTG